MTEPIVRSATAGIKENDSSFTSILGSLFAPLPKKRVKELGLSEQDELRYAGRLSSEVESSGSVDRVAVGKYCLPSSNSIDLYVYQDASNII